MSKHPGSLERAVGVRADGGLARAPRAALERAITVKLAAQGFAVQGGPGPGALGGADTDLLELAGDLFPRYAEQRRLLSRHLCPADWRIQGFIDQVLGSVGGAQLPTQTLTLDRYGLARELSLPRASDTYQNAYVTSVRLDNGVLHNPASDRRTTQGVFHVADFGLPVPADKLAVPLATFAALLRAAFTPPEELLALPYTVGWDVPVHSWVSLLLRPLVRPAMPGRSAHKSLETRFFVPGALVSNLDFVESIFGNAGDPELPENDAALDVEHWSGHTGCVVLAPHLTTLRKRDVGLPRFEDATPRQREQGLCYRDPEERYNAGSAFKITLRDARGVMVTILADNYFGYCKKEVKTQISFSANLGGLAEEEHSGGALAFSTFSLGTRFLPDPRIVGTDHSYEGALALLGERFEPHPEGYASARDYPQVHLLPEDMQLDLRGQEATWRQQGQLRRLRLLPDHVYLHPSGYKVRLEKHPAAPTWRLVGTVPEGTFCHKPCTVSGGGKSEISKSLSDAIHFGPVWVGDVDADLDAVQGIIARDYAACLLPTQRASQKDPARPVLSSERSLGSVIKLLTPNPDLYTAEHNAFVRAIPNHVRAIVFLVKQFYDASWGEDWRSRFSVDRINGVAGHELRALGRRLVGSYLRVGLAEGGGLRIFKLRQDFMPADKVQMEDDITASVVVPAASVPGLPPEYAGHESVKIAQNCEYRLFQRPDDAITPGFDLQTERDMAAPGLFASNFQPLSAEEMRDLSEQVELHTRFSAPMQGHISAAAARDEGFSVCSAKPRLVDGKPTKNPRYLQVRPDLSRPRERYVAEIGARLYRRVPSTQEVVFPVTSVMSGRRNNPPDQLKGKRIRPLCVYNPIHYQELPELFMDYICSVTGKSPSTTGAGSEGALTKGPFNALCATADLNAALVSMLLTGYAGFSSAAGHIGPRYRVDHDISLLIPEVWSRLFPEERDPQRMIALGHLEPVEDFEFNGQTVLASRLGYRITERFVHTYLGRIFDTPSVVFPDDMLRPERQSLEIFADGVNNLTEAQQRAARLYFEDGSVDDACPPLRALLHVMAYGEFEGRGAQDPAFRAQFTRRALLESHWYAERLSILAEREAALARRLVAALEEFAERPGYAAEAARLGVPERLVAARQWLEQLEAKDATRALWGTLGADPLHRGL